MLNSTRFLVVALTTAALLMGTVQVEVNAAEKCSAEPFINSAARTLMKAATGGSPEGFSSAVAKISDVDSIALFALGPYRNKLPKARQREYVQLTRAYIGRFLAEHADRFVADGIAIKSCKASGGSLLVDSRLSSGERMIWRLSGNVSNYRVEDVSVQKIWLAQQLRTNFVHMIRTSGYSVNALIDQLS